VNFFSIQASDSDEREEVEDNVIPGTPPNKKVT
jgi:hypothetical protein